MKKALIGLAVLLVVGAVGAATAWYLYEQRITAFGAAAFGKPEARLVDIPPGSNPKAVAKLLAAAGIVSDGELMYEWLRREKVGPKLKAGEYEYAGALTPAQVVEKLVRGEVKQYHFTVPEGLRADEILPILAASELKLSKEKLQAITGDQAWLKKVGLPAASIEGFLYPDTYSFPRGATEQTVLEKMVGRTLEEVRKATRKTGVELNTLQAVTLASIVEKETGAAEERPRISCVFHNRLRLKMKLQTDPTVIYAKMLRTGEYSKNITRKDLEAEHPYNTYTMKGLPPGPIANPGAAAIKAALNPLTCDDLFFVSRNDGTHVFCPDLKCHEENVEKWQVQFFRKGH